MISFSHKGDFSKTSKFLSRATKGLQLVDLDKYGAEGVAALSSNTPVDSGLTASSWNYKISKSKGRTIISWYNSNIMDGMPIAIILQYGHGTQNGGWVEGKDYINPVMKPIFDKMAERAWKEVNKI